MKNYWDILPIELQEYILSLKKELILKEQQNIIDNTPLNTLIEYSVNKFDNSNTFINKDYICKIQKIDTKLIMDLINFEMVLNYNNYHNTTWKNFNETKKIDKSREILEKINLENIDFDLSGDNLYIFSQYIVSKI